MTTIDHLNLAWLLQHSLISAFPAGAMLDDKQKGKTL
jgi:hypothetical protein